MMRDMTYPTTPTLRACRDAIGSRAGVLRMSAAALADLRKGLGPSWAWVNDDLRPKIWGNVLVVQDDSVHGWVFEAETPDTPSTEARQRAKDRAAVWTGRPDTPSTEALTPRTAAGRDAVEAEAAWPHSQGRTLRYVLAIEAECAERAVRQEAADTSGLREAAQALASATTTYLDTQRSPSSWAMDRGRLYRATEAVRAALRGATERPLDVTPATPEEASRGYRRHLIQNHGRSKGECACGAAELRERLREAVRESERRGYATVVVARDDLAELVGEGPKPLPTQGQAPRVAPDSSRT